MNISPPSSASVAVAMSGGVDSSVAAALLVEKGCRVFGLTAKLWCYAENPPRDRSCCSLAAIDDARAAAAVLGIRHYVVDLERAFEERVVRPFCLEYSRGRTPNPCVLCNSYVKFEVLLDKARSLGADYLATGHYAMLEAASAGGRVLRRARDRQKDQSYVLWGIKSERMQEVLFPLGELTKVQVRQAASRLGFRSAKRRESQDVCFVESGDCGGFVARRLEGMGVIAGPGSLVDNNGRTLGTHKGLVYYTVGQRRGLGVAAGERRYVVRLEPESNAVVVGKRSELQARQFTCSCINWLGGAGSLPLRALVQVRYTHSPAPALLEESADGRLKVTFDESQCALTPGQSAVFYEADVVLGGAVIDQVKGD